MKTETKVCQNCKNQFTIEPEDFDFYEKIQVPAPTFCPECRFQRRLSFFNLTTLYKRPCDLCKKDTLSMYPLDAPYTIYCPTCWWSDNWDPYEYGRDYDFTRPFFEQFNELMHEAPMIGLGVDTPTLFNSSYNNHAGHLKNCHLIFQSDFNEDTAYGLYLKGNKSLLDCSFCMSGDQCYDCMNLFKSSRCVGTRGNLRESLDCVFLKDSDNCQNCFASANLKNKKYYIFNKPYTKEDYFTEIGKWDLGSYKAYQDLKNKAKEHWMKFPPRPVHDNFSVNCTGSYIFESKNCKECYDVASAEDCKFIFMLTLPPLKDLYDVSSWGNGMQLCYESSASGEHSSYLKFCSESGINAMHLEYCRVCFGGTNIFGCVGMKKGEYTILNKKYSKEEYEALLPKIIQHMNDMPYVDKRGVTYKYGEFFPIELSPFAYADTMAQKFFPLSETDTKSNNFVWRDLEKSEYPITMRPSDLPDHIKDAPDTIVNEVIECEKCARGFKIINMELNFLKRMNLPLPRLCPFCRIGEKMDQWVKNLTLGDRVCDECGAGFRTHYTKDDAPHVLCKECWLKEVV